MRLALRWGCLAAANVAVAACAGAPPAPDRLAALGPVAVVARVEAPPVCRLDGAGAAAEGEGAGRRLERLLASFEQAFETETRFRGELVDGFRGRPPFPVVPPGRVDSLQGSLLVREEGPPDYANLARAGVGAVLELAVLRMELVAADADHPAGLRVAVRARFVELADGDETWSREVVLEPRAGGPLAFDPAAPGEELERRYLAALAAAAREVGRETAAAFSGGRPLP